MNTLRSEDEEILKACISLFINDATLISYVSTRIRQEGQFVPTIDAVPLITVWVQMDRSWYGLPTCTGSIKISVYNSTKKSENMKISRLIGARIFNIMDDKEGKDNINSEGTLKQYYPKIRMIERQNAFFMPTELDNITRYVQNFNLVIGKQS